MNGAFRFSRWFVLLLLLANPPVTFGAPASENEGLALRGVFADAFGTQYRDHLSTMRLARQLKDFEVQNCFLQVWVLGESYYKSSVLPAPAGMPVGYDDPLADLLKELESGSGDSVRVQAWINPLQAHNERAIVPPPEAHVAKKHPEWLTKDIEGNSADANGWVYLDPGHPEVQDYVAQIVKELAGKYAIAGIFVDGLHYPEQGSRFGYNEKALEQYRKDTGAKGVPDPLDASWLEWRRQQINKLLARITKEVKQTKANLIVSAAALAAGPAPKSDEGFKFSQPYMAYMQDWPRWAELDMVDWIVIENFADEQTEANRFDDWTRFAVQNKGQTKLWVAVAGYRNWAIDAFRQIQRARMDEADAVAIYNFRQPVRDIATAPDFFAAVRSVTLLPRATTTTEPSAGLEERLARMEEALERSQLALMAAEEIAPGVRTPSTAPLVPTTSQVDEGPTRPPFLAPWDYIYLTNRSMFEGHKIGEVSGESIFETSSGLIIKINNQYIDRIRPGQ